MAVAIGLYGRHHAAELDIEMGPRQPAVGGSSLHGLGGAGAGAEGVDVDARYEGHDIAAVAAAVGGFRLVPCHWPTSLIQAFCSALTGVEGSLGVR